MPFAVTLRLDAAASEHVRALWSVLADRGLSTSGPSLGYAPHITLAVHGDDADPDAIQSRLGPLAASWRALSVHIAGLGCFPGSPSILWLVPVAGEALLQRHAELCAALPPDSLHAHYRPHAWVPHFTLADDLATPEVAGAALAALSASWEPFDGLLDCMELVRFRPVTRLWQCELR